MATDSGVWAGLDTSTRTFRVCLIDRQGELIKEETVPASIDDLEEALGGYGPHIVSMCAETGTTSMDITRKLRNRGYNVTIYNPRHVHNFIRVRLNKTDDNDARGLAEIARIGGEYLHHSYLKSVDHMCIRNQIVVRDLLIKHRKGIERVMFSIMHMHGVRAAGRIFSETSLQREVQGLIETISLDYGDNIRKQILPLLELAIALRRMVRQLNSELRRIALSDPVCRRFLEIPGVGVLSALSFTTAIGEPHRFQHVTDVGAFLGLTPRTWQTGKYRRRFGISKAGSPLTRKHLFSAAKAMLNSRKDVPLKQWALKLAKRSNRRKAIVALSRKLAILMLVMWKNGTSYEQRPVVTI